MRSTVAVVAALLAAACSDSGVGPQTREAPVARHRLSAYVCAVSMVGESARCRPKSSSTGGRGDVLLTPAKVAPQVSGLVIDSVQNYAWLYVALANQMPDSLVSEPVAFIADDPVVTEGSGVVAVLNNDGVDTFTATNQPYFEYGPAILAGRSTAAKEWQFDVTSGVRAFEVTVYVSATGVSHYTPLTLTLPDSVWSEVLNVPHPPYVVYPPCDIPLEFAGGTLPRFFSGFVRYSPYPLNLEEATIYDVPMDSATLAANLLNGAGALLGTDVPPNQAPNYTASLRLRYRDHGVIDSVTASMKCVRKIIGDPDT